MNERERINIRVCVRERVRILKYEREKVSKKKLKKQMSFQCLRHVKYHRQLNFAHRPETVTSMLLIYHKTAHNTY